jgi:hypothetical protein
MQHLCNLFWRSWVREYLPLLQQRQMWMVAKKKVAVNQIVLLLDEKNCVVSGHWPGC